MSDTSSNLFALYQGTVISVRKWSDTHVWSSGGGGYVDPKFGGHVAAAQLNSQVVDRVEVFIKETDGQQHALELSDIGIPLSEGNKIIAIMDERWQGKPRVLYFENLDIRMSTAPVISTGLPQSEFFAGFGKGLFWGFLACMSTLVLGTNFFGNSGWFFFCLVGFPVWWLANLSISSKKTSVFSADNAAFLRAVQDAAKHRGIDFGAKDPVFGPLSRIV